MLDKKPLYRLATVQNTLKAPKSEFNKHGKFNYRTLESILSNVKTKLTEEGLFLSIEDEVIQLGDRFYIKATVSIIDIETGELVHKTQSIAREPNDQRGMNITQLTGSASTYARKYALNALFLIDDTKDIDGIKQPDNNRFNNQNNNNFNNQNNYTPNQNNYTPPPVQQTNYSHPVPALEQLKQWVKAENTIERSNWLLGMAKVETINNIVPENAIKILNSINKSKKNGK